MSDSNDIDIRESGRTGRITLTRPQALNALTYDMAMAIEAAIDRWEADRSVDLVVVDAEGDKAFCAGGDVAALYRSGRDGDYSEGRRFWADEYRMNARLANCPIPCLSMMDGIVMGGGVGISAHGSHRVVTERSLIAMPECGIGLIPDVGGSRLLARAPGRLGEFLGISGWRMTGADAIFAGFADIEIASSDARPLVAALEERADPTILDDFRQEPEDAPLEGHLAAIDRHFAHETVLDCIRSLETDTSDFARKTLSKIRRACPISVACTVEIVRRARSFDTIEECLALEYRFTHRAMSDGEFLEGVRAQLIDKDRDPKWKTARLEDVTPDMIEAMLAPLGADELVL